MTISTDVLIIGAGPSGLFAAFKAGQLELSARIVDSLPQAGGQLAELYPYKTISDVPGIPTIEAKSLVDNLLRQIEPFNISMHLGERVETLSALPDKTFELHTSSGSIVICRAIILAAGLGSFAPRKPDLAGIQLFENKGVEYAIHDIEKFRAKNLVIAGGGDSALDWSMQLATVAQRLCLVHRRSDFRGNPASAHKIKQMAAIGQLELLMNANVTRLGGAEYLEWVEITRPEGTIQVDCNYFMPLFGLSPKLGPISTWGFQIQKGNLCVNPATCQTKVPGVYAIGDLCTYEGKLKFILSGFQEAALAMHAAYSYLNGGKQAKIRYATD
ncbi:MAG: NAD(P)/FAD-dependent oxidoreductase [Saprospiraceae bacterium]|nr:NAD(P)/FAD-dependent oxidoreductase [Saprospiraceae bacterium]